MSKLPITKRDANACLRVWAKAVAEKKQNKRRNPTHEVLCNGIIHSRYHKEELAQIACDEFNRIDTLNTYTVRKSKLK